MLDPFSVKYDVCFVGLKCYDLLRNAPVPKYLGGIERALVSLAKGMTQKGYKVAFIVYDEGQDAVIEHGGITVFRAYKPKAGIKFLRLIHPQATALNRLLKRIKSDKVIQMGAGIEMSFSARPVKQTASDFIYIIASNSDCQPDLPLVSTQHEKLIYKYGLRWADVIVAQSKHQQTLMKNHFGYDSQVIPMPHYIEHPSNAQTRQLNDKPSVLWVGRIIEVKRLELLLDLAEQKPDTHFHVVGAANEASEYATAQTQRAHSLSNVTYHGKVSDDQLYQLFTQCDILACTSSLEGFPMAFIEAWYFGMPVLTTFDPDDIVQNNQLGVVASDLASLQAGLEALTQGLEHYRKMSSIACDFYHAHYSVDAVIPQYISLGK